jgi:hypothetical protein
VARRGKFKDLQIPIGGIGGLERLPTTTAFEDVRWVEEKKKKGKGRKNTVEEASTQVQTSTGTTKSSPQLSSTDDQTSYPDEDVEEIIRTEDSTLCERLVCSTLQPWIAPLSAQARMLFAYFSEAVAPVMVILDTASNGYRELLLPMAFEDDVLRRAVSVVAAQHLSREKPEMQDPADAGRAAVIARLRKDSESATADQVFNQYTWATLIVLLVGETVTGSTDYGFLIQMLLCLSANSRAEEENSTTMIFLKTQTNMCV